MKTETTINIDFILEMSDKELIDYIEKHKGDKDNGYVAYAYAELESRRESAADAAEIMATAKEESQINDTWDDTLEGPNS